MEVEIFETDLGLFKAIAQDKNENVLFVQTYLIHNGEGYWENVGYMKRKDFVNLIKPHNPKKKVNDQNATDTFWAAYSSTV
jgi:hypothetical protein